jgi:hypothetical protein
LNTAPQKPINTSKDFHPVSDESSAGNRLDTAVKAIDEINSAAHKQSTMFSDRGGKYFSGLTEMVDAQMRATMDYWSHVAAVKTLHELVELTTAQTRTQFDLYQSHIGKLKKTASRSFGAAGESFVAAKAAH